MNEIKKINKEKILKGFFDYEIYKLNKEIEKQKDEIKSLVLNQATLKRGKTELYRLRKLIV